MPAHYYITQYNYGEDGFKPHNFVTIGGKKLDLKSVSFVGENDPQSQYSWLPWGNISMSHWNVTNLFEYVNTKRSKPSDHQLVIITSTSKLSITFLNDTLPSPPSKYNN